MQSDLLDRGRSLEDLGDTLSWWDLWCIVDNLPATSAYRRLVDPNGVYRTEEMLLAILAADGVRGNTSLWQTLVAAPLEAQDSTAEAEKKPAKVLDVRAELARRKAEFAAQKAAESAS